MPPVEGTGANHWREATTADGKRYFVNDRLMTTTWDRPDDFLAPPPPRVPGLPTPAVAPEADATLCCDHCGPYGRTADGHSSPRCLILTKLGTFGVGMFVIFIWLVITLA